MRLLRVYNHLRNHLFNECLLNFSTLITVMTGYIMVITSGESPKLDVVKLEHIFKTMKVCFLRV